MEDGSGSGVCDVDIRGDGCLMPDALLSYGYLLSSPSHLPSSLLLPPSTASPSTRGNTAETSKEEAGSSSKGRDGRPEDRDACRRRRSGGSDQGSGTHADWAASHGHGNVISRERAVMVVSREFHNFSTRESSINEIHQGNLVLVDPESCEPIIATAKLPPIRGAACQQLFTSTVLNFRRANRERGESGLTNPKWRATAVDQSRLVAERVGVERGFDAEDVA
ncbi:hypothetical protein DFH09DRAFT_1390806 [Mycena vulgaris]|nr:hypothetical protein DFH09DRAFT_1390806 [Mycena vulgaris]